MPAIIPKTAIGLAGLPEVLSTVTTLVLLQRGQTLPWNSVEQSEHFFIDIIQGFSRCVLLSRAAS